MKISKKSLEDSSTIAQRLNLQGTMKSSTSVYPKKYLKASAVNGGSNTTNPL